MLKADQVPKEAIEAAAVMLSNGKTTAQAIAAAINAWPGMKLNPSWELRTHKRSVEMILPVSEPPKMDRKAAVAERLFGDD